MYKKAKLVLFAVIAALALLSTALLLHGCGNGTMPGQTVFFGAGS